MLTLHHAFDFIQEADVSLDNLSGPDELLDSVAMLLKKRVQSERSREMFHQGDRKAKL